MRTLIFTLFLLCSLQAIAQFDTCNVFLKGNYVQVGIAPNGCFGSTCDAPTGYYPNVTQSFYNPCDTGLTFSNNRLSLGFIADPDKDGWTVGSPAYYGDYFLPGVPQEGWAIGMNDSEANAYDPNLQTNGASGFSKTTLTGQNVSYTSTGSSVSSTWSGTYTLSAASELSITQNISIDANSLYAVAHITLKNTGTNTVRKIYYMRTFDADDDEKQSGDYATRNVCQQLPNANNIVSVSTWGLHYPKAFCELGTINCRAKAFVLTGGLAPVATMASMYAGTASSVRYDSSNADEGVGIIFSLDTLIAGDSLTFSYAYIFKETDAASFFAIPTTTWAASVDSNTHRSGDTVLFCASGGPITLSVTNISYDQWTWYSPTGNTITPTTGTSVNVYPLGTSTIIVKAIGTSSQCIIRPDTTTMILAPRPISSSSSIIITGPILKKTGLTVNMIASLINSPSTYNIVWTINGVYLGTTPANNISFTKLAGNDTISAAIVSTIFGCPDTVFSNIWVVLDPNYTGVISLQHENNITTYPNPVKNELTISNINMNDQIMVYDELGRKMATWTATTDGNNIFNTAPLAIGIYILRITDKNGNVKAKIPLQKL